MKRVILVIFFITTALSDVPYKFTVKRLNNAEPLISSQYKSTNAGQGTSTFTYNYNCAFVPLSGQKSALLVRSQNLTQTGNPYLVGPSVITYVEMTGDITDPNTLKMTPITSSSIVVEPEKQYDDMYGTEDPRVAYDNQTGIYYLLFSAVANTTNGIPVSKLALSVSKNPGVKSSWKFDGPIFPQIKWSKSGALLIRETQPSYLFWGDSTLIPGIQLATTENLVNYTNQPGIWLGTRETYFDSVLVEAGPLPYQLSDGNYLFLYNSARKGYPSKKPNWDLQYNVGWVILDGQDPTKILYRSSAPILSPETPWEIGISPYLGLTPNVVFVEGWARTSKPDTFILFYGAADSVVGVAELTVTIDNHKL